MTAAALAELIGARTPVDGGTELCRVSGIPDASPDAVVFALDAATLKRALESPAGAILAPLTLDSYGDRVLCVKDPKYAFALSGKALVVPADEDLVHDSAVVHPSARLGAGTRVAAGAVVEADVIVGADSSIGSRVTLCRGARLGDRVVVQAGAVLGSAGFGYVRDAETGEYLLFPQQGSLVIEDDVEIGANTTIDRGALGETRIGRGTKIDNLVHIGHNCSIGKNVVIAAQVGISGSCTVGDGVVLAGQVGLGDHVHLGDGITLGGQGGVFPGKTVEGPGQMFGGTPAEPVRDYLKSLARLRRLK